MEGLNFLPPASGMRVQKKPFSAYPAVYNPNRVIVCVKDVQDSTEKINIYSSPLINHVFIVIFPWNQ